MTGNGPRTEWYIARDGEQHGPLSEAEMRAFIERRYLRATDLVWREGFVDWRPAPLIFPMQAHDIPSAGVGGIAPTRLEEDFATFARETAEAGHERTVKSSIVAKALQQGLALLQAFAERLKLRQPQGALADRRFRRLRRPWREAPIGKAVLVAAVAAALLAGVGILAMNRGTLLRMAGLDGRGANAATGAIGPAVAPQSIDDRLQTIPLWVTLKHEFPDWYAEVMFKAAKLPEDEQSGPALSKHVAEALVTFRRQHAGAGLAASQPRLIAIAQAFVANLNALKALGADACYAFISQGETSPAAVELLEKPESGQALFNHVAAVAAAISEGQTAPVSREKPSKADYDTLASGLTKLGWSEEDLKLFANPRALARSTPDKVCQMVHDWFEAHLAIKDAAAQERLLVETLRPVVAG